MELKTDLLGRISCVSSQRFSYTILLIQCAERQRRNLVGNVGLGVTGVLALALWATGQPGLLRFAAVYPLFALAGAFRVSGEAGL